MRFIKSALYGVLIVFIALSVCIGWSVHQYLSSPLMDQKIALSLEIVPGTSAKSLAQDLHQQGLIKHPLFLDLLARVRREDQKLQAGQYLFPPSTTPSQFLNSIVSGNAVLQKFTIIPGWTSQQLLTALKQSSPLILKDTIKDSTPDELIVSLGLQHPSLEGAFLPQTYCFNAGYSNRKILRLAHVGMQTALANEWSHRASGLPYTTPYQALIMASLIEEEAKLDSDRPKIASVLINRMNKGMPLQVDASTRYVLSVSGKRMTVAEANQQLQSPYNTYKNYGLPPTPIDMPGLASLHAALHPAKTSYLYYVLQNVATGAHSFSKTFAKHKEEIRKYMRSRESGH